MRVFWKLSIALLLWVSIATAVRGQGTLPPEVAQHGYADMIVVNGKIITVDDAGLNQNPGSIVEAMAIKGNRIIALGTTARIRTLGDSNTKALDLMGQTVIPGVIESHVHIFGDQRIAQEMGLKFPGLSVMVEAGRDIETTRMKVENAIRDTLKKAQPEDWIRVIVGANRQEKITDSHVVSWATLGNLEPRERLDRLSKDNPIFVQTTYRATVNSKAWEIMKKYFPSLDDYYETALPDLHNSGEKGVIGVEGQVALQWEVWWGEAPLSLLADMMRRTLQVTVAHGITTFSSRLAHPRQMDVYALLNRESRLPLRYAVLMEGHRRPRDPNTVRQFYEMTGNLTGVGGDRFWISGVASELWDSSFPQACLGADMPAPPDIKRREMCPVPGELYYDTLHNALRSGWRLAGVHGVGSEGVRRYIKMIDSVVQEGKLTVEDVRNLRLTIEHAEALGTMPDVIEGLKKYGIIVSVHPPRLNRYPDYLRDYGPAIKPFMEPVKTWLNQGVSVVGQMERFRNVGYVWTILMTRKIYTGEVVNPEEAIDRVTALKMWTNWAARYVLKEKEIGSLEVGKLADFLVIDKDYLTIPIADIPHIRPQMTVVGGEIEFLDKGYAAKLRMQPVGYQFEDNYEPWGAYTPEFGGGGG